MDTNRTRYDAIIYTIDYPEACLSQNRERGHWAKTAERKKIARARARRATEEALRKSRVKINKETKIRVELVFHPPMLKRRRDLQNLIGAAKYAVDGIADALGIDDSEFKLAFDWGEPIDDGITVVTISEARR